MVAVLASPRFLFRIEEADPAHRPKRHIQLWTSTALASRLSYFLWSSMPDDELFALADKGELRNTCLRRSNGCWPIGRSEALVQNFVGQWLQVRNVEGISINEQAVMAPKTRS